MASKAQKNVSSPLLQLHSFYTNLLFTCFDQIDLRSVHSTCHNLSLEPTLLSVWNVLRISNLLPSSFSIQLRCHLLREASPKSPHLFPSIIFPVHRSNVLLLIHLFSCCCHQNISSMRARIINILFTTVYTQQGCGMNNFRGH